MSSLVHKVSTIKARWLQQLPYSRRKHQQLTSLMRLQGVPTGALRLDAAAMAGIFQCTITQWNDPHLLALNSNITCATQLHFPLPLVLLPTSSGCMPAAMCRCLARTAASGIWSETHSRVHLCQHGCICSNVMASDTVSINDL